LARLSQIDICLSPQDDVLGTVTWLSSEEDTDTAGAAISDGSIPLLLTAPPTEEDLWWRETLVVAAPPPIAIAIAMGWTDALAAVPLAGKAADDVEGTLPLRSCNLSSASRTSCRRWVPSDSAFLTKTSTNSIRTQILQPTGYSIDVIIRKGITKREKKTLK